MMRLSQAAKKLNVGTITIIEILSSKGHRIDNNPNAKLSFDLLEVLSKELHAPNLLGEMDSPSFNNPSSTIENVRSNDDDDDEILYFRDEPEVAAEPEKIKIEHSLQGTTILGKIDLSGKSGNKILPIDEKPSDAIIEEKIVIKEEPKIEAIKVEPLQKL